MGTNQWLLTLMFATLTICYIYGQDDAWHVVKIRGNIYTDSGKLYVGNTFRTNEKICFSNTSDVMLIRDYKYYYFTKPDKFEQDVSKGKNKICCKDSIGNTIENLTPRPATYGTSDNYMSYTCKKVTYTIKYLLYKEVDIERSWKNFYIKYNEYINILTCNTIFHSNEKIMIVNQYTLRLSDAGNLEILVGNKKIWSTQISSVGNYIKIEEKGNLSIFDKNNNAIWQTSHYDSPCNYLELNLDGNLMLRTPEGKIIWETRTQNGTNNSNAKGHSASKKVKNFNNTAKYIIKPVLSDHVLSLSIDPVTKKGVVLLKELRDVRENYWYLIREIQRIDDPYETEHGFFRISREKDKNLKVMNTSDQQIAIGRYEDISNQQWDIVHTLDEKYYFIRNTANGYYLEIQNNSIQLAPFTGNKNQMWKIDPIK